MAVFGNLIAGEWREGGEARANINPSDTNDVIGDYAAGTRRDVEEAVAAARQALKGWSHHTEQQRADILFRTADEIFARREELGRLLAREEGKTPAEGMGEVVRASQIFRYFAGEVVRYGGEFLPSVRPGIDISIRREPVGVVGLITPWNFPFAIPAWKIAPALAYGNTVVLKPADLTPASAWAIADILKRAGVPDGVFNLVMGRGSVVGQAIVELTDAVSFTGSVPTGTGIVQKAAARMIRVQCEMGGKNPLVVMDDADLDVAVNCAVDGGYFQNGQRCTASSRLIVHEAIHDRFVAGVAERLEKFVIDHALKPGTQLGPVIDGKQLEQDLSYVDIGEGEGGGAVVRGQRLNRETPGFYTSPTLFTDTTNDMRINREEVFGPVAAVIRVKDYEEALATANDTAYGLSSGIVTRSQKLAQHFQANSESGLTMVNLPTAGLDYHVPFGGRKGSSYGPREQGRYAAEFYTIVKTSYAMPV